MANFTNNTNDRKNFLLQAYSTSYVDNREVEDPQKSTSKSDNNNGEEQDGEDDEEEGEEGEEVEFTPSAWDASLAPHKSAIRSPERSTKPKVLFIDIETLIAKYFRGKSQCFNKLTYVSMFF